MLVGLLGDDLTRSHSASWCAGSLTHPAVMPADPTTFVAYLSRGQILILAWPLGMSPCRFYAGRRAGCPPAAGAWLVRNAPARPRPGAALGMLKWARRGCSHRPIGLVSREGDRAACCLGMDDSRIAGQTCCG